MFLPQLILTVFLIGVLDAAAIDSSSPPPFLLKTGRSRLKYNENPRPQFYDWRMVSILPSLNRRSSFLVPLPVWRRYGNRAAQLTRLQSLKGRRNAGRSSGIGCREGNGRCFFGSDDEWQSRPSFMTPPPLRPMTQFTYPGYGDFYGGEYGHGSYYGGGDDDYYEICDEFYDPILDEYLEDCNVVTDYYRKGLQEAI